MPQVISTKARLECHQIETPRVQQLAHSTRTFESLDRYLPEFTHTWDNICSRRYSIPDRQVPNWEALQAQRAEHFASVRALHQQLDTRMQGYLQRQGLFVVTRQDAVACYFHLTRHSMREMDEATELRLGLPTMPLVPSELADVHLRYMMLVLFRFQIHPSSDPFLFHMRPETFKINMESVASKWLVEVLQEWEMILSPSIPLNLSEEPLSATKSTSRKRKALTGATTTQKKHKTNPKRHRSSRRRSSA